MSQPAVKHATYWTAAQSAVLARCTAGIGTGHGISSFRSTPSTSLEDTATYASFNGEVLAEQCSLDLGLSCGRVGVTCIELHEASPMFPPYREKKIE